MGDPRKIKKKYSGPRHPWEGPRIEEEKILLKEYGLSNKKEIWKMDSMLTSFKDQVKKLISLSGEQAEKEKAQLMNRLVSLGVLQAGASLDQVLSLDLRSLMDRRLQSVVCKQGLARTMKQARQMVVHEHITVNGTKVTVPSYIVRVGEEIGFSEGSLMKDPMHPERKEKEVVKDKIVKKEKTEEEEILAFKKEEILDEDAMALAALKKKETAKAEATVEAPAEKPKEVAAEVPAEPAKETPVEETKEEPVEAETPVEAPAEEVKEEPAAEEPVPEEEEAKETKEPKEAKE